MKIGIISDSHGNIPYLKKAGKFLKETAKVGLIVHLGDECDDADVLKNLGLEVIKIPGLYSASCVDPDMPARVVKEIEGVKIFLTHSPEFPANEFPPDAKAVFYGHTHIEKIENRNGVLWVNPGHLREHDEKGKPASFAVVDIKNNTINAKIIKYSDIA